MTSTAPPVSFSHVGVTVPDLSAAIEWYGRVLGMYLLKGPIEVVEDDSSRGRAVASIYGTDFQRFRFAHLCGPDGVGLELFHFDNPPTTPRENNFEYWRTGMHHFGVTARDVHATAERIASEGGRIRSAPLVIDPGKGYAVIYCEDPWGTVIEVCSHPYAQMWA
ncbi:VOC family protein [Streptomyces muensis]|uniref:VOC family protein n=1 Tax=Streptomyces muensis TaxID=1077944 RepID=A0A9X1PRU2_STRM4|nr:VOC family protein [Streptomyces muensis]MCF1592357.1 VOC family protein [Streptomyces muensis]